MGPSIDAKTLVADLNTMGISLEGVDGKLRYRPKQLPDGVLDLLCRYKLNLLSYLTQENSLASADTDTNCGMPKKDGIVSAQPAVKMPLMLEEMRPYLSPLDYAELSTRRCRPGPCVWCGGIWRHSASCEELHRAWSIEMPWGKHKDLSSRSRTSNPPLHVTAAACSGFRVQRLTSRRGR